MIINILDMYLAVKYAFFIVNIYIHIYIYIYIYIHICVQTGRSNSVCCNY